MTLLLDGTIKASVIVAVALAANVCFRRRSAAVRHWVLSAAIVCAVAAPALTRVVPAWHMPWTASLASTRTLEPSELITAGVETEQGAVRDASAARVQPSWTLDAAFFARVWVAGFVISLLMLGAGLVQLAWLAATATPVVGGVWTSLTDEVSSTYGLTRRVRLLQSDRPAMLATWGVLRPKVVLPRSAGEWEADRVRVVLSHELAHIRRHDWTLQLVAELLRALYWFNPLIWLACRRLRQESEQACDDAVLNLGVDSTRYATHLLELARAFTTSRSSWFPSPPAPAIARPSSLEGRIVAMLNARLNRNPISRSSAVAIVTVVTVVTLVLAGFGAAAQIVFGGLSGTVSDQMGRIVPGVSLILSNAATTSKYEVQGDGVGRFEFVGLPSGDYELAARMPGFVTVKGTLTMSGQDARRNIVLQIGEIEETITVVTNGRPGPPPPDTPRVAVRDTKEDKCSTLTVGGCIRPPTMIRHVSPYYPPGAGASGIEGVVNLQGTIGTDGFVSELRAVKPANPDLVAAAVQAVSQWEYLPTHLDGVPIETHLNVTVNFAYRK